MEQFFLPDPRRYPDGGQHPLLDLAGAAGAELERMLVAAIRALLLDAGDAEVRRALALAPDREAYVRLWRALCAASEGAGAAEEVVAASVFAIPVVIVAGSKRGAELPGAIADSGALAGVLEQAGALGASRNFGLSAALSSLESLERVAPSALLAWRDPAAAVGTERALAPAPIPVRPGEEVHLRFLLGAALTPAAAPAIAETAAHMGAWGMPFARALGRQLTVPGVELFALPRPPAGVLRAAYQGRRAQLEVALNLFLSNAIRRMRLAAGEPTLIISVHEAAAGGGELRASMSAALDDTLLEGFRWPLHPLEDPGEVAAAIAQFAADCRMTDVRLVESVLPGRGGPDAPAFLRAGDVPGTPLRH